MNRLRKLLGRRAQQTQRTKPELVFYKRADKRWAWRCVASNGQIVATDGGQGYERFLDCVRGAESAAAVLGGAVRHNRWVISDERG